MLSQTDIESLAESFPLLVRSETITLLSAHAHVQLLAEGESFLSAGKYIKFIPLVLKGSLKVLKDSEEGYELFLYYLNEGQTCAMALSCCGTAQVSTLHIVAEIPTQILAVPIVILDDLSRNQDWKIFIAQNYASRFHELLEVIDDIAFHKMDSRLAKYLHAKVEQLNTRSLSLTHQTIALELGTSREVVSRLLKQMEKQGMVTLHRNRLELTDRFQLN